MKRATTLLTALLLLLTLFSSCAKPLEKMAATDLLDLGEKYLLEMNYEKAIVYFDRLIEVEPRNPRGYTGLAEAYVATGENDKAVETLRDGLEQLPGDMTIKAMLDALIQSASALEISESPPPIQNAASALEPLFIKLIDLYKTAGYEAVLEEIRTEEFDSSLKTGVPESDSDPVIYNTAGNVGCGLYYVYGVIFVYIGEYDGLLRSGSGIWLNANRADKGYYMFSGIWKQDEPNGEGKSIEVNDISAIEKQEGYTYALEIRTSGFFSNGLEEGAINKQWVMDNGHTHSWNVTADGGYYQIIGSTEWSDTVVAFCTECNASLSNVEAVNGVRGFTH